MTFEEFLVRLRKTPRQWFLDRGTFGPSLIRLKRKKGATHCPISAVTGKPGDFTNPKAGAYRLGLSSATGEAIIIAADNTKGHRSKVRKALLDACGLTEVGV